MSLSREPHIGVNYQLVISKQQSDDPFLIGNIRLFIAETFNTELFLPFLSFPFLSSHEHSNQ